MCVNHRAGGAKTICQRRSSLDISAFALARQGLRCAALIGIGASTKANDGICEFSFTPIDAVGVPSTIEAGMHVAFVRVLFQFMQDGCRGLGASCTSVLNVRAVSAGAGRDGLARERLATARRDARPVRRFPDVEPYACSVEKVGVTLEPKQVVPASQNLEYG